MEFSTVLKNLRESRNITQEQLAKHLQVSRSTVAGYETGRRQPDIGRLCKLSSLFDVSLDYLLTRTSAASPQELEPVISEKGLDRKVMRAYKTLSTASRQDVLEYIQLLQLKEKQQK